jgi:hypothetical protein
MIMEIGYSKLVPGRVFWPMGPMGNGFLAQGKEKIGLP